MFATIAASAPPPDPTFEVDRLLLLHGLAHEARKILLQPRQALRFPRLPRLQPAPLVAAPRFCRQAAQRRSARRREAVRFGQQAAEATGGRRETQRSRAAKQRRVDVFVDERRGRRREGDGLHARVWLHARVLDGALQLGQEADAVFRDADERCGDDLKEEEEAAHRAYCEDELARGSHVLDDRVGSVEERQLEKKDVLHQLALDLRVERRMAVYISTVLLQLEHPRAQSTRRNSDRFTIATIS